MHRLTRRGLLKSTLATAPLALTSGLSTPALSQADDGLAALASQKGVLFGSAINSTGLDNVALTDIVKRECAVVVSENAMKWKTLRPREDKFLFDRADRFVDFAEQNGMAIRGHTLAWHRGLPDWFLLLEDKSKATEAYINHIKTVAGRYAGRMHSWDVVNESTQPGDGSF